MLTGKHYINGQWIGSEDTFLSNPVTGDGSSISIGSAELIDMAAEAAEDAFYQYSGLSVTERAAFLRTIASEIDARGDLLTEIGVKETGLPAARLEGERGRTVMQLRLFADFIEKEDFLDKRHDPALPDRAPLPRSDLRLEQRPVGPVAIFGASNFPLAFSVAGGDTASALAAGCPVVVKGHEAHPGVSEITAQAIAAAINACQMPKGVFSLIHGGSNLVGSSLVEHPLISAVGFTGSFNGGKALFDLCAKREIPIPFFGELGSINPVFILSNALKNRGTEIAQDWANSLSMGAGQFCTNPGILFMQDGEDADKFIAAAQHSLVAMSDQHMLTDGIASAYFEGVASMASCDGVEILLRPESKTRSASPALLVTTASVFAKSSILKEEVFGPAGIIVKVSSSDEILQIARELKGQLTCTLQMDDSDKAQAMALFPILERKAGRLLANGFPTGVEVCDAMVHGGPYPASTNFGATSVGTMAIRRFLRPVCYQDIPVDWLKN